MYIYIYINHFLSKSSGGLIKEQNVDVMMKVMMMMMMMMMKK